MKDLYVRISGATNEAKTMQIGDVVLRTTF